MVTITTHRLGVCKIKAKANEQAGGCSNPMITIKRKLSKIQRAPNKAMATSEEGIIGENWNIRSAQKAPVSAPMI